MPRTDNDTWDLATSVGATATMVAAARAIATNADTPLINDRFAEPLVRAVGVDFLTIGQYLQPSRKHHPVVRFVPPDEFKALAMIAYAKGFSMVSASPLTRSSHHAGEDFARLKAQRTAR